MSKITLEKNRKECISERREEKDSKIQHLYEEVEELNLYNNPEGERIQFPHMYQEKVFYLSFKSRQSITTGFMPSRNCNFKFCIRLDDFCYCAQLYLTLYHYVNLMKQIRKVILSSDQERYYDKVDANIQFKFKDMNAPSVVIKRHLTANAPILYRFFLPNSEGELTERILFKSKTLRKMIG